MRLQELGELEKKELDGSATNLPPYIVAVGPLSKPSKVFVVIREARFEYKDILEGVDICFKASIALHKWSKLSNHLWSFLQKYVYNLESNQSSAFVQHIPVALTDFFLKIEKLL